MVYYGMLTSILGYILYVNSKLRAIIINAKSLLTKNVYVKEKIYFPGRNAYECMVLIQIS